MYIALLITLILEILIGVNLEIIPIISMLVFVSAFTVIIRKSEVSHKRMLYVILTIGAISHIVVSMYNFNDPFTSYNLTAAFLTYHLVSGVLFSILYFNGEKKYLRIIILHTISLINTLNLLIKEFLGKDYSEFILGSLLLYVVFLGLAIEYIILTVKMKKKY
jgi:hypothetical protein